MSESTTDARIVPLPTGRDAITGLLREGARRLLAEAIEAEVAAWIEAHAHLKDASGRQQVVRNDHLPGRAIQTGIGEVEVQHPSPAARSCAQPGRIVPGRSVPSD